MPWNKMGGGSNPKKKSLMFIENGIEFVDGTSSYYGVSGYFNSRMTPTKSFKEGFVQFNGPGTQWTAGGMYIFNDPVDFSKYKSAKITYATTSSGGSTYTRQCVCIHESSTIPSNIDIPATYALDIPSTSGFNDVKTIEYTFPKANGSGYLIFGLHEIINPLNTYGLWKIVTLELIPRD